MELWLGLLIGVVVGAAIAAIATRAVMQPRVAETVAAAEAEIVEKREAAEREIDNIMRVSREEAQELRLEADKAIERRYHDLARAEERVDRRSANQDQQAKNLEQRDQVLNKRQSRLDKRQNDLGNLEQEHRQKLEETAAMTTDEARQVLIQQVEKEAQQDLARVMREIDNRAKETAEEQARKIIALSIQRLAGEQVADMVVSVVPLPSDEMKGRIIGRNGRNIRAFEQAAGVDIIVDDTPEAVTVSRFDPVR
nr:Rnase Y domain-containing protein [Promineifilum sp.]